MATKIDMAKFAKFCKDMGFIFQSSEIYGGINGFWDYGPLGVELKRNIKEAWWQDMVRNPPPGPDGQEIRMVGLDCSIIMNPKVWVASGHVGGFADPMVDCKETKGRYRADHITIFAVEWVRPEGGTFATTEPYFATVADIHSPDEVLIEPHKKAIAELKRKPPAPGLVFRITRIGGFAGKDAIYSPEIRAKTVIQGATQPGTLMEPRSFNLMNQTYVGAIQSEDNVAYLRPETAQGIFVNFKNVLDSTRVKLPFGIAQIGKAFRNEINPRNFIFRSREFEQMEIEFFCHPAESMKWYEYWRDLRKRWYSQLGIKSDNLRPREQGKEELAHYSIGTTDIEYLFPFSDEPQELEGVAHRGAFDLTAHANHSGLGEKLAYFDEAAWMADAGQRTTNAFEQWIKTANPTKEQIEKYKFYPHVVEPSAGADRFTLAVLCEAYTEEQVPDAKGNPETRIVMKFHPRLAPIKCAVLPLVNKDGMPEKATALYRELKPHFNVFYDDKGAIGRRYRRQDEAGTPFCVTIDGDTMKDDTVTIRDRDSMQQRRVPIGQVREEIMRALAPGS
ncbi:MAG TPA: glycine--tRNA ligase [Fimbriiglobus sp.]|nr:glycine--tRNA ligase [Fimbriiglobus sp.]